MTARIWTRQEVERLVAGRAIYLRDAATVAMAVPGWLAAAAGMVSTIGTAQRMAATHVDDRSALVDSYLVALATPGASASAIVRLSVGGRWVEHEFLNVNLLDLDDVGGMLLVMSSADAIAPADPVADALVGDYDSVNWMSASLDIGGRIRSAEGKCQEVLGLTVDELVGHSLLDFLHPDAYHDSLPMWLGLIATRGATRSSRKLYERPDGSTIWVETSYLNRLNADGSGDVQALLYDISDRRAAEEALRESHEQNRHLADEFRLLAEEVPAAVFKADHTGRITFFNQRWRELCEIERSDHNLRDIVTADAREAVDAMLADLATDDTRSSRTIEARSRDDQRTLSIVCRSVQESGSAPRSFVGSVSDVTDAEVMRHRADYDGLTGLLNRRAMEEQVDRWLAAGQGGLVAFIDLNGFKAINDTFGHDAGDEVLRGFAARLRRVLRADDIAARYGGDEFLVVCPNAVETATEALIHRITGAMSDPIAFPGGSWSPSSSVGVARPEPGDDTGTVIRRADLAMLASKQEHHQRAT